MVVLFTAVGQRVDIVRAFKAAGAVTLGVDLDPLAPALYHCDRRVIVPPIVDLAYIPTLAELVREHDVQEALSGTVQNDILKEYVARGTWIYPPAPSMRLATDLFASDEPVGKSVFVDGVPFTVVGATRKKLQSSNYNGQRDERCAFIPWTTYASLYGAKYVSNIIFRPLDLRRSMAVMEDVKAHLAKLVGFDPADPDALGVWDTLDFEKQFTTFFLAFTIFLGVIGSFTLLVGGIGVASIMSVVVEERTREIGVKLAVGARRRTILMQFFSESIVIMLLGGIAGLGLWAGVIQAAQAFKEGSFTEFVGIPVLNPMVIVSTITILLGIGVVAGLIPARTAASTDPIEALRK